VGDSDGGKTFLTMTCLAEATRNPNFANYRLIYDDTEGGALMDIRKFYGNTMADRLEPPRVDESGEPIYSYLLEDFYDNITAVIDQGIPFIYVLDSMDVLSSHAEVDKAVEQRNDRKKGKKITGSYGDGKAKINAGNIRRLLKPLGAMGSILMVVNQTRDRISDFGYEKKTRSGGHALKFYATVEMWLRPIGDITKTVKGKKRQQGVNCSVRIKKNRLCGQRHEVTFPIYHSYGIDDVGSCVDYLVSEGHWKQTKSIIHAPEFRVSKRRDGLIKMIEQNNREHELRILVGEVWSEIAQAAELQGRKKRYK
jgi:RecA/RadA recombinase